MPADRDALYRPIPRRRVAINAYEVRMREKEMNSKGCRTCPERSLHNNLVAHDARIAEITEKLKSAKQQLQDKKRELYANAVVKLADVFDRARKYFLKELKLQKSKDHASPCIDLIGWIFENPKNNVPFMLDAWLTSSKYEEYYQLSLLAGSDIPEDFKGQDATKDTSEDNIRFSWFVIQNFQDSSKRKNQPGLNITIDLDNMFHEVISDDNLNVYKVEHPSSASIYIITRMKEKIVE